MSWIMQWLIASNKSWWKSTYVTLTTWSSWTIPAWITNIDVLVVAWWWESWKSYWGYTFR